MRLSAKNKILDTVAEDLFSTMPLIGRSIRRKLLKTALTGFNEDISPLHFEIMKLLEEARCLHIAEIGERLQIARPQMTRLIDKLVELGLVERYADETDRRMINIELTQKGKNTIKEHEGYIRNATREALSQLTEDDLLELSALLRRLGVIFSRLGAER